MDLSVILITKNEAHHLANCLASVQDAKQIIVVDSGSTDDTVAIAKQFGATVIITPDWPGFGPQKNRALSYATEEWVLSLDADEVVDAGLRQEIMAAIQHPQADAYWIPRTSQYCGQFIQHSGWTPDYIVRLFKREKGQFSNKLVHEVVEVEGVIGKLSVPLKHYSYDDFEEVLDKVNRYSSAGAEELFKRGKQSSLIGAIGHGLWAFVRTYLLRRGFLDGASGLMLAISNAEASYYKYIKLRYLHQRQKSASPKRG